MSLKKFKRKYWLIIVGLIILLLIFYPRHCGNWGTAIDPGARYKDCVCVGIKYSPPLVGGGGITCFGVPVSYSCYSYERKGTDESWVPEKIEIPCD